MLTKTIAILSFLLASAAQAHLITPTERRAILDAVRPVAAEQAGQPVRIVVGRINEDQGWAVLVGALVTPRGTDLDWSLADNCHPDLDKGLWAVLRRTSGVWHVKHIDICDPEPAWWDLDRYGGLVWPCGVYAGLEDGDRDLQAECRAKHQSLAPRKRRSGRP
jgi:hypothetical protein